MHLKTTAKRLAGVIAAAGLAVGTIACGTAEADEPDPTLVATEQGRLQGTTDDGVRSWLGVPYAAPPVGDLRWASPEPAASWDGVRDADEFAPACAQGESAMGMPSVPSEAEDCLYLNVYAPDIADDDLPVMVWFHGGGNAYGAAEQYDPSRLVTDGEVVVVTVNYRQGLFGTLAHPALDGGNGEILSGDYGLQDQQAALEWVRSNASAFGGDEGSVTVFGQSGGGYDVCAHLASAGSAGLFDKAIVQSAMCATDWATSREEGQALAVGIAEGLGCDESTGDIAACLRQIDTADVIAAGSELFETQPVIGGPVMPVPTGEALASGEFNRVPILHGVNSDEMQGHPAGAGVEDEESYLAALTGLFGEDAAAIAEEYPLDDFEVPAKAVGAIMTDSDWAAGMERTREVLGDQVPAFTYELSVSDAPYFDYVPRPGYRLDAFHMVDCAFLFDTAFFEPMRESQEPLAELMIASWSEFARSGDPDGEGPWEPYATDADVRELSPEGARNIDFADEHHLGFWRSLHA
ncbi:carboxylesterase/lipase family protein [Glycomyces arizonensis]|uniref:carboxylesterase/lipase family protein n=1 Tax=Glycomyces arizonensis TaxID=256035 RepID=UPI000429AE61|nr:carboxylesterase family protein [Glycomyces arizonensis]